MRFCSVLALVFPAVLGIGTAGAEQPPAPCHPNPNAAADEAAVRARGDVINLPGPLQDRLAQLANRPHTICRCRCSPKQMAQANCFNTTCSILRVSNLMSLLPYFRG